MSNLPAFVFTHLLASGQGRSVLSRIITFRLVEDQESRNEIKGLKDFALRLSNAVIDGAANIQVSLQPHLYHVAIPTGKIRSTDFKEVGAKQKKELHEAGNKAVLKFINSERSIVRKSNASIPYQGFDEKMLLLVQELQACDHVFLAVGPSTYWLDFVFPMVLAIARRGVQIVVITKESNEANKVKEERRHWLLRELGADVIVVNGALPFDGFAFDIKEDKGTALMSTLEGAPVGQNNFMGDRTRLYTRDSDPAVLELLDEKLAQFWVRKNVVERSLAYRPCADVELFQRLKTISHYANAKFRLADVEVSDNILVLQQSVKEFKVLQIKNHISDLQRRGCDLFDLVDVSLPGGRNTIVTPPVLERLSNNLILIEGNTRFFHCLAAGITSVRAVIVDNVSSMLPAQNPRPLSTLKLISSTTSIDQMYTNVDRSLFRPIEEVVHND